MFRAFNAARIPAKCVRRPRPTRFATPPAERPGLSPQARIISIYGTGFGPSPTVRIGSVNAALLYVSPTQINAIVPYGVAGWVVITVEGLSVTVPAAETAPAIFTFPDGRAASWSDGSVVSLLVTGEGATTRPELYGRIVEGKLPRVLAPVRAWIGGVEAEVLYAGGAPGLVAGVAQVNVRIPASAPSGVQPITLRIGRFTTPFGPTLTVR